VSSIGGGGRVVRPTEKTRGNPPLLGKEKRLGDYLGGGKGERAKAETRYRKAVLVIIDGGRRGAIANRVRTVRGIAELVPDGKRDYIGMEEKVRTALHPRCSQSIISYGVRGKKKKSARGSAAACSLLTGNDTRPWEGKKTRGAGGPRL